jgi:hypothetical protein
VFSPGPFWCWNFQSRCVNFSKNDFAGSLEKFLPLPLEAGTRFAAAIRS